MGAQPYPRHLMVTASAPPERSPTRPGSYQFKDAQGRVIYVGKAASLRQRLSNYFGDPRDTAPAHGADGRQTAESVEWIEVRNEVEALMLEYTLIKQHRPALQRPPARRQELPVPRRHRRRGVAAGAGDARPQAQGHPLLRALRPRLRHPRHARPAAAHRSRSARAARPSSTSTSGSAGRACCSTSRSARARASARSTRCRTASSSTSCATSSTATPTPIVKRLDARDAGRPPTSWSSSGRPASATG